jgi:SAM-dependent methyltransferase
VVTETFYLETVRRLVSEGWLRLDDRVLVIAGGTADRDVLLAEGLRDVTISNLDERMAPDAYAPFGWSFEDAENLTFADGWFDVCIVHQGLHHCRSPHRGLLEMYRVARRGVLVFEPQDTLLTRLGVWMGVGQRYEIAAVADNAVRWGGVQNTDVPNFVYRWTERDIRKTLASFDPTGEPHVRCVYDFRVPGEAAAATRGRAAQAVAQVAVPVVRRFLRLVPSQANAIGLVIDKVDPDRDLHPWLRIDDSGVRADESWFRGASASERS